MSNENNKYRDLIVITNRNLVEGNFLKQMKKVVKLHPQSCILREKDLDDKEYLELAKQVLKICDEANVPFFVHSRFEIANELGTRRIHLPFQKFLEADKEYLKENFDSISVSSHSIEETRIATKNGATQIILGTIFETDCKKGLKGKGLEFVRKNCQIDTKEIYNAGLMTGKIPVYAIGGISLENIEEVKKAGAAGGCMMSGFMKI